MNANAMVWKDMVRNSFECQLYGAKKFPNYPPSHVDSKLPKWFLKSLILFESITAIVKKSSQDRNTSKKSLLGVAFASTLRDIHQEGQRLTTN